MNYYRILDDLTIKNRWFLGSVNFDGEGDFWKYICAGEVEAPIKELEISIREEGMPLDFTMADFELLILNLKTSCLISKDEGQFIPIKLKGYSTLNDFYLFIVKNEVDCVDEEHSTFKKWERGNKIRPDKVGHYRSIYKLIIDPTRIQGYDIFRIRKSGVEVIISEKLKNKFEQNNITGIKYKKVTI